MFTGEEFSRLETASFTYHTEVGDETEVNEEHT